MYIVYGRRASIARPRNSARFDVVRILLRVANPADSRVHRLQSVEWSIQLPSYSESSLKVASHLVEFLFECFVHVSSIAGSPGLDISTMRFSILPQRRILRRNPKILPELETDNFV
jgi:hypothetical protein